MPVIFGISIFDAQDEHPLREEARIETNKRGAVNKRNSALLFTVWGVTISCLSLKLPWQLGIGEILAKLLYKMLPAPVYELLGESWMGGDWIILLMGAVLAPFLALQYGLSIADCSCVQN